MKIALQLLKIVAVISICWSSSDAGAQSVIDQYNRSISPAIEVPSLGSDLFGEEASTLDGALAFRATDVVVRTNHGIPMSVGRVLSIQDQTTDQINGGVFMDNAPFGVMWDLDVPRMRVVTDARGWTGSDGSGNRCSNGSSMPTITGLPPFNTVIYYPEDYYSGVTVSIPGYGTKHLMQIDAGVSIPNDGQVYKKVARGNWRARCLSSMTRGTGQGFVVVLPDGAEYTFDWLVETRAPYIMDATCPNVASADVFPSTNVMGNYTSSTICMTGYAVPRSQFTLYATKAKDRFNNTVTYSFDPTNPQRLTTVTSSDGAVITLTYSPNSQNVQKISTGDREWNYVYGGSAGVRLENVTMDDGSKWTYEYESDYKAITKTLPKLLWAGCLLNVGTMSTSVTPGPGETSWLKITHPSGAVGEFKFRRIIHGTRETEQGCVLQGVGTLGGYYPSISGPPSAYQIASLYEKSVTGPGITPQAWTYQYNPGWLAPFIAETVVTHSSGRIDKYRFQTNRELGYGDLLSSTVGTSTSILETTNYDYVTAGQNFRPQEGHEYSIATSGWSWNASEDRNRPVRRIETIRQGRRFVWEVNSGCLQAGAYCFDEYTRPTSVTKKSLEQ